MKDAALSLVPASRQTKHKGNGAGGKPILDNPHQTASKSALHGR
jgi:hypothetical protein